MSTRAETMRLRRAGRVPAETVAYLNAKKMDGGMGYTPDRWMRALAEIGMLCLLYVVLADRGVNLGFRVFAVAMGWMVLRSVYRLLCVGYRRYGGRRVLAG